MVQSMTGYGKCEAEIDGRTLMVQIKSVNSKTADLNIKLPPFLREKEGDVRAYLIQELTRGKIDILVNIDSVDSEQSYGLNKDVLRNYFNNLRAASEDLNVPDAELFSIASKFPNVLSQEKDAFDEEIWKAVEKAIQAALKELTEFRRKEGKSLQEDLENRVNSIRTLQDKIKPLENERIDKLRSRLDEQVRQLELGDNLNRDRFEQEMIYYIEKYDLNEEQVRLSAHLALFLETMGQDQSQGRKLNFIAQEIGREINTIGSKANHADIQRYVVEMKDDLEKIKEQLYNVL